MGDQIKVYLQFDKFILSNCYSSTFVLEKNNWQYDNNQG